jgi:hypothetical protein
MQSHGITLSFHREMADSSSELAGPDVTDAVNFESYPRFIKGGFQDYEGLGSKDPLPIPSMFPPYDRGCQETTSFGASPQKVVEFLELPGVSGDHSKLRP